MEFNGFQPTLPLRSPQVASTPTQGSPTDPLGTPAGEGLVGDQAREEAGLGIFNFVQWNSKLFFYYIHTGNEWK
jgi:hypothetical protein